ncbi:MAG: hypothetical protein ACM31D_16620 [Bacteroidota bacterium]
MPDHPALPVGECLSHAVTSTFLQPVKVLRAFWPLVCTEAATAFAGEGALRFALMSVSLVLAIPCACAWHRYLIEGDVPRLKVGLPEWTYTKRALLITLLIAVLTVPFAVAYAVLVEMAPKVAVAALVAGLAVPIWFTGPTMLTLAAAAINRDTPLTAIKALAEGNRARLFALLFGISAAETGLTVASDYARAAGPAVHFAVAVIFWPLAVAVLSMAYIWLNQSANVESAP